MAQGEPIESIPFDGSEGTMFNCLDCNKPTVLTDGCGSQEKDGEVQGFICIPCCEKFEAEVEKQKAEVKPIVERAATKPDTKVVWNPQFILQVTQGLKRGLNRGVVDAELRKLRCSLTTRESWEALRNAYRELCTAGRAS
jgi:hypothetical protein